MTNSEFVAFYNQHFSGRTIERTELVVSCGEEYMRWWFIDGCHLDWHISMFRGSNESLPITATEGRLFKEEE